MSSNTVEATPLSAQEHAATFSGRRRTIAVMVVALAFIMDLLDSTIVNIAIPSIQADLGASYSTIQWLVAGYSLTFALLLITGGRLGDVVGYKKIFMVGVGGFTIASLLSGLAWSSEVLIAARLLQGAMAALMAPQVMSLMQVMYKQEERGSVMGIFGAMAGIAASLGPIIGGFLIEANFFNLDWRPIFLINVPVGILGLWLGAKYLPNGKSPHPLKLDLLGTGIVIVALSLLVYPLIQGRDLGWPAWTYLMMAASIPLLVIFAYQQKWKQAKDGSPLVITSLFRLPSFSIGLLVNVIFEAAMLGYFLTFTLVLQAGLGFDVLKAAVTGIPLALGISVSIAVIGQKLAIKIGRYTMTLGTSIMAAGLLLMSYTFGHAGLNASGWHFTPALLLIGVGMGLVMAPIFAVVLNDVDPHHAGSASGVLSAVQQVGGAIGIALIGVIFFGQLSHNASTSFSQVEPQLRSDLAAAQIPSAAQDQIVKGVETCFVDRSSQKDMSETPESCKQLQGGDQGQAATPAEQAVDKAIETSAKQANANNFHHAFKVGVIYELVLLGSIFLLSFFLPRHIRPEAMEAGH